MHLQLKGTGEMFADYVMLLPKDRLVRVGRDASNDIILNSKRIAHFQAEIVADAHGYLIYNRASRNSTRVNGQRITIHRLQPGDEIAFGDLVFFVEPIANDRPADTDQQTVDDLPAAYLHAESGVLAGQVFVIHNNSKIQLGRDLDNDIVIDNKHVSRRHAEIVADANGYLVHDLQSHNGTRVNRRRITTHRLQSNDTISFSNQTFRFEAIATVDEDAIASIELDETRTAAPEQAPQGIQCPGRCRRVYPFNLEHCPLDGALLANGQTVYS